MDRISRKAAKAAGLKHYFTGKPCKRAGHIDRRYVASFMCMTCAREKRFDDYQRWTPEKRTTRREYNIRRWQDPRFRAYSQAYKRREEELAKQRARNRVWKKANRASCTDRQNKRHAILYSVFVEDVSRAEIFERDGGRCQL